MAAATWRYRGDSGAEQPALLVRFSNGRLQQSDSLQFTVYRNKDKVHPRKKHRRILVSETERLSYVGNNFSSGVLKCNSLCRYFVGVLDKDSGQMEVYNAEIFHMQPLLSDNIIAEDSREYQNKSYREKMDLCIEAFGTSKQKRALSTRRLNTVGSDVVSTAVSRAAASVIDAKGVTALIQDMTQEDTQNISSFLPPCNEDAEKPEQVYKFEDILSPAEYEALRVPAAAFVNITAEEIAKKAEEKSHCSFVLEQLKLLPADGKSRDHRARCLWFLDTLVKFSCLKVIRKKHPMGPDCPHTISRKLMKNFTSLTYNNGSVQNLISASMKAKITAYVIALALHINSFQTDLTVLQNDLKLPESRVLDIARAMRLRISNAKGLPGLEEDQKHKLGILSLPLPVQKAAEGRRKRRRMT
ncbi:DNA-directed RNA polymerase I subunit RPA49 [Indicator indicator]|uniref:DNA-directed RNA polymerase I subunit RPA49 n=1 Tax=Indicator indicator TaxID=1002788 RepID=UPI0023DEF307|nr:DNA-directed RNA polymerase I subunit RPA49 [Indicator indicator]